MNPRPRPCPPCGLLSEDVQQFNFVGPRGLCTAFHADENAVDDDGQRLICGESLGAHPHSQTGPKNTTLDAPASVTNVNSFDDAIDILSQENLIDSQRGQYSSLWLQENLGCATDMAFQGRKQDMKIASKHIQDFSNRTSHRSPYLVVVGSSGSGKSRFMCEVGKEAQEKDYLVLATTFNHETDFVPADDLGLTIPQFPVVARLLFQYARNDNREVWSTWCNRLMDVHNIYPRLISFLQLEAVVCFLKFKYSKEKAVLLIDETYRFIQKEILKWKDSDLRNFMRMIVSIQDRGVAVIFSAFIAILVSEEGLISTRFVSTLHMTELSSMNVKTIVSGPDSRKCLAPFSTTLGLDFDQTMELLYSCLGGLPRVVEGLTIELQKLSHFEILSLVDAVGRYIAQRYYPPSFELIMAAFRSKYYPLDSLIRIQNRHYTIRDLQLNGFCSNPGYFSGEEISLNLSSAQLFAAVYSTQTDITCVNTDQHLVFRHLLKELLFIPMIKNHSIWEEFVRRFVVLRSLNYMTPTNIPLGDLFHPAIQVGDCLRSTHILMTNIYPQSIRYFLPPSPAEVQRVPSIWLPDSQFESGVDTLMFFNRVPFASSSLPDDQDEMETGDVNNRICVGIQNKWSSDDQTKITYSTMRNAVNHFTSKMTVQGWSPHQLYFMFITNLSIHDYILKELPLLFDEQIGIISATEDMLDRWLSPTMKFMVARFQALATHDPSHEVYNHKKTKKKILEDQKNTKVAFKKLTDIDKNNPERNKHFKQRKEKRSFEVMMQKENVAPTIRLKKRSKNTKSSKKK